jgi:2',3'-cyclic-nucleotide 2'-phosphodiesterase (5'-nucleotidase family)
MKMKFSQGLLYSFCFLISAGCSKQIWHTADARYVRYEIGNEEGDNEELAELVAPYKAQLDSKMGVVIGQLDVELLKERVESNMGNWYTDIILEEANLLSDKKVDFAMQNYGGLRSNSIAAGDITVRTIYEVMPFENTLVTADLSGEKVITLFDYIAEYGGAPISKGVKFEIKDGKAINISIDGKPIDLKRNYRVAVSDYIANGGDDSNIFNGASLQEYDLLQRDALINHIKRDTENGIIQTAKKEGRITKLN